MAIGTLAYLSGLILIASFGFSLYAILAKKGRGAIAVNSLLTLLIFSVWLYLQRKATQAAHVSAPVPVTAAVAAPASPPPAPVLAPAPAAAPATPPKLEWCQETPEKHCMLESCLASLKDGKPTFVLMGADWCPGCREIKHVIKYLDGPQEALAKYRLVNLDSDVNPDLADAIPSRIIPAGFILGKSCEVARMYSGTKQIRNFFGTPNHPLR